MSDERLGRPREPLTVLYVTDTSAPNQLLLGLVRELHPDSVRFVAATLDAGGALDDQLAPYDVDVHHVGAPGSASRPRLALRLRRLLQQVRPDIVHTNLFWPGVLVEATRRSILRPAPTVFTRHHDMSHHLSGDRVHAALDSWTAKRASLVIAPSQAVARTLVEREHVPRTRIRVIPHAIHWPSLLADAEDASAWRQRFPAERLAVVASRLDPLKDHPTLLRAFARAREALPDLELVVAGEAMPGVREELERLAAELSVGGAVHFIGWQPKVSGLLKSADVVVQASLAESFGLTALEAAGLGVPLAMTTPGGLREVLPAAHPRIEPGDVESLAARMVSVLADPQASRRDAEDDAARIRALYSLSVMAERHLDAYGAVAGLRSDRVEGAA